MSTAFTPAARAGMLGAGDRFQFRFASCNRSLNLRIMRTAISMLARIIRSKVVLWIRSGSTSSSASAAVVRGNPSSTESSPKKSPFSRMRDLLLHAVPNPEQAHLARLDDANSRSRGRLRSKWPRPPGGGASGS